MLQATRVFKDEVTRQNKMYWLSGYSFARTEAILRAIASCGQNADDPRVDLVWPSVNEDEARVVTIRTSELRASFSAVRQTILTNAILHLCSAFEAMLDGFHNLGLLYRPDLGVRTKTLNPVSKAASNKVAWEKLRSEAMREVKGRDTHLKGRYSERIRTLYEKFSMELPSEVQGLDDYYSQRHIIAHDQSLRSSSDPLRSYKEIVESRLTLDERAWKAMLGVFWTMAKRLDADLTTKIVTDRGLAIAVWKELDHAGAMKIGHLRHAMSSTWGIQQTYGEIEAAVRAIGGSVSAEKRPLQRLAHL